MNLWLKPWMLVILISLAGVSNSAGNSKIEEIQVLPPAEQYRQLSLILIIAGGANPVLLESLAPQNRDNLDRTLKPLSPDDYKTPLIRIVDQETMLAGAGFLLRFAEESRVDIQTRLAAINASNPVLISMLDMNAITEDAIIIRNAIADAIDYSGLVDDDVIAAQLQIYRTRTIYIRNVMEYELFDEELARLTDEAILSVGGKLDAYQRMFDEELDTKEFDRQFDAAAFIYNRTEKFDEKAFKLTEEIMKNVILSQSRPNP